MEKFILWEFFLLLYKCKTFDLVLNDQVSYLDNVPSDPFLKSPGSRKSHEGHWATSERHERIVSE